MTATSPLDKLALCTALGWSRPKLDRRLKADPNFPVRKRGNSRGGWEFDLPVVLQYLAQNPPAPKPGRPPLKPDAPAADAAPALPADGPVQHQGEATAKQRRDEAQAAMLEDKLRRERGELLEREPVRQVIADVMVRINKALDHLPLQICKKLGLREDQAEPIAALIQAQQTELAASLDAALS